MRKWNFDYGRVQRSYDDYDPASGDAPPVVGKYRHDTLVPNNGTYEFDDQSDDVPAKLLPKRYIFNTYVERGAYPHPLLCTPMGRLDVLPDHMHEGECIVPDRMDQTFTFGNYTAEEYPADESGNRVRPEVVAYVETVGGHKTRLEKKDLFGGQRGDTREVTEFPDREVVNAIFGAIGAYNGHYAGVGRVVVDSTFHHFVNLNLNGTHSNSTDPLKQKGFLASAGGQYYYEKIKHYFRNIALWIAPPAVQRRVFERALWTARWDSQLKMQAPVPESSLRGWRDITTYGLAVREALIRLHPPCYIREWVLAAIDPNAQLFPYEVYIDFTRPDPPPWDVRKVLMSVEDVVTATLAGMMTELQRFSPMRSQDIRQRAETEMSSVISRGVQLGLNHANMFYRSGLEDTAKLLDSVSAVRGEATGQ